MNFQNRRTGSSLAVRLMLGSAVSTLALGSAYAQNAATGLETVVVTGTSIRGAAPVGADLTIVGRSQIEATMQPTVQSLFSDIPELGNFGTSGVNNQNSDRGGGFSPTIHNVGAGSSIATLTLINGHRIPGTGTTESNSDPNIVASSAVERVEVLPDGASSIYGADAVVGVVNVITRKNFRGLELNAQSQIADHYVTFNGSGVFGTGWDTGSVMVAYDYSSKPDLPNTARDFVTGRQDIRRGAAPASSLFDANPTFVNGAPALPAGQMTVTPAAGPGTTGPFGVAIPYPSAGQNFQNFNCPVASIAASSSANAFYYQPGGGYGGPSFSTSTSGNPGNGACDTLASGDLVSSETRNNIFISSVQEITSNVSVATNFSFSTRIDRSPTSRGTLTATAFGPGPVPAGIVAGQVNPFYQTNPTIGNSSETIRYSFDALLGPGAFDKVYVNDGFVTSDLTWDLGGEREITVGGVAGLNYNQQHDAGQVSQGAAILALNGSTNSSGTISNSIPDNAGFGTVFPGSRVLNTLNALDVWDPAGPTNKTSADVLRNIKDGGFDQSSNQTIQDFTTKFDGPVFDLPAGPVKLAVGAEFLHQTMEEGGTNITSADTAFTTSQAYYYRTGRSVYSAFTEVQVPLVSEDMKVPLMQKFEIDVAGRYDKYSDFGDTENPKVSFDWFVFDGLKARGSFGTSFVAPGLHDSLGNNSQSIVGAAGTPTNNNIVFGVPNTYNGGAGTANTWVNTPANCAAGGGTVVNQALTAVTGPAFTGAYACQVKFGATSGSGTSAAYQIAGGHLGLQPAHGHSYSAGVDADFGKLIPFLDGLTTSATYWQTTYLGLVTGGASVHPSLTYFAPVGGASPTSAFAQNFLAGRSLGIAVPPLLWATVDNRLNNSFDIWMNGIDYSVNYAIHTEDMGTFHFSWSGTETLRYSQSPHPIGGVNESAIVDGKDGKNSPRYGGAANEAQFRATLGWQLDNLGVTLGYNYTHPSLGTDNSFPYSLPGPNRGQIDPTTGLWKSAGFIHLGGLSVFDLSANYTLTKGFAGLPDMVSEGTQVSFKIANVLNQFTFTPSSSGGISGGNPVGRAFTIGIRKKF